MLPWQPIKFSDLDKIRMNSRGLLKKHSAICEIWKESASRLQRRSRLKMLTDGRTTDGRTTDACLYYKLTYERSAQVSLKRCFQFFQSV